MVSHVRNMVEVNKLVFGSTKKFDIGELTYGPMSHHFPVSAGVTINSGN